jgi:hypothetical protein
LRFFSEEKVSRDSSKCLKINFYLFRGRTLLKELIKEQTHRDLDKSHLNPMAWPAT